IHASLLARRLAHSHSNAVIGVRAQGLVDRLQPVMPTRSAALLDPQADGLEIDVVVNDDQVLRRDLVETCERGHAGAGTVHVSQRLDQYDLLSLYAGLPDLALVPDLRSLRVP